MRSGPPSRRPSTRTSPSAVSEPLNRDPGPRTVFATVIVPGRYHRRAGRVNVCPVGAVRCCLDRDRSICLGHPDHHVRALYLVPVVGAVPNWNGPGPHFGPVGRRIGWRGGNRIARLVDPRIDCPIGPWVWCWAGRPIARRDVLPNGARDVAARRAWRGRGGPCAGTVARRGVCRRGRGLHRGRGNGRIRPRRSPCCDALGAARPAQSRARRTASPLRGRDRADGCGSRSSRRFPRSRVRAAACRRAFSSAA